jgi:hypothetical protein
MQAAIRTVAHWLGRGFDALFAMRQAEMIVRALKVAGYEIKRQS